MNCVGSGRPSSFCAGADEAFRRRGQQRVFHCSAVAAQVDGVHHGECASDSEEKAYEEAGDRGKRDAHVAFDGTTQRLRGKGLENGLVVFRKIFTDSHSYEAGGEDDSDEGQCEKEIMHSSHLIGTNSCGLQCHAKGTGTAITRWWCDG
jgi:hypothetical protein